uniref:Uncharacterized protein n=1 Tax=Solanum lycopersicum TaxID=4081 RepID=A0A3Q7IME7_SOLLC
MSKERNNCKAKLNHLMLKLKKIIDHLQLIPKSSNKVPNDVKEGHFAIFSVNAQEEPMRFIVELYWLNDPSFLKLLKQTEDEYGFGQKGVLEVHCHAAELQKILKLKFIDQTKMTSDLENDDYLV